MSLDFCAHRLVVSRLSGERNPSPPADPVSAEAYSHEVTSDPGEDTWAPPWTEPKTGYCQAGSSDGWRIRPDIALEPCSLRRE